MSTHGSRAFGARASYLLAILVTPAAASADCSLITRSNLVSCAAEHSPLLAAELATSRAAEGKREAARPFLPSNPVVIGSLASRTGQDARATNWSVTLSQELEIAGQSGLRVDVADGELSAQQHQVAVARASVAEQTWLAWFDAVAAREGAVLAAELEKASVALSTTVQGMATHGLASSVDAAVADAAAVRASRARLEAANEAIVTEVRLRTLLGAQTRLEFTGALQPLDPDTDTNAGASGGRPETLALAALKRSASKRVELLRRSRAPNPSVSLFAQNDGFDERVFGVSLGLPIPLPQPVGRTRAGEVAEAVGDEGRLAAEAAQLERGLASDRELAAAAWESSVQARALFTAERLERARQALAAIAEQLAAARIAVRAALADQQALMELLQGDLASRHALCAASVRLRRATGASLEGGDL
jgi:outer membrane protein, heavy metal efflux system